VVVFRQDAFLPDLVSAHPNQKPLLVQRHKHGRKLLSFSLHCAAARTC